MIFRHSLPEIRFVFHEVIIAAMPEGYINISVIGFDSTLFQTFSKAVRRLTRKAKKAVNQ